jgi:hypothetical protein
LVDRWRTSNGKDNRRSLRDYKQKGNSDGKDSGNNKGKGSNSDSKDSGSGDGRDTGNGKRKDKMRRLFGGGAVAELA